MLFEVPGVVNSLWTSSFPSCMLSKPLLATSTGKNLKPITEKNIFNVRSTPKKRFLLIVETDTEERIYFFIRCVEEAKKSNGWMLFSLAHDLMLDTAGLVLAGFVTGDRWDMGAETWDRGKQAFGEDACFFYYFLSFL